MRGVYSMAALAELEDQGLADAFDVVIGTSAGAVNGAYFLARQANDAVSVYTHSLNSRTFFNPARVRRIVDVDFMVDVALKERLPIDQEALFSSESELCVVVTDTESGEAHFLSTRDLAFDTYEVFRATAAIPILYNKRIEINGRTYVDGALTDAIPVEEAISRGAGLIVSVLTRAPTYRHQAMGPVRRASANFLSRGHTEEVRGLIGLELRKLNEALEFLSGDKEFPTGVQSHTVWPTDLKRLVSLGTINQERLLDCAQLGRADMRAALAKAAY